MQVTQFFIWGFLFLILFRTDNKIRSKKGTVDKVKTIVIIVVSYYILFTFLGLIMGFESSPYSQKVNEIIKNIFLIFIVKIEEEYVRTKSLNYFQSKFYYLLITIIFVGLNIDYKIFEQQNLSNEQIVEYVLSRIIT